MNAHTMNARELFNLLSSLCIAVAAHRRAAAAISYKISQAPTFGCIDQQMVEEYERTRLDLLNIEDELRKAMR